MHRHLAIAFKCDHIADRQAVSLKILRTGEVEHLKQFFQNLVVRHILPHGGQISIVGDLVMLRVGRFASTIQLPHRSKSFIEDFFVMPQLHTVTVTDEDSGALTPEGNLTLVDDYHTSYSDGSGQQFITLVSKSGNTFYLVIDRNSKGENTVHFMNLVDESDLLSLMDDEDAEAYTAEKEAAAQAELERKQAEEEARKAEEAAASGTDQPKENKITKYAATFLGVLALVGLAAGGGIYVFMKQKQKKQAEKEALDPDADYTEDKGDFEIPVEDDSDEDVTEDTPDE